MTNDLLSDALLVATMIDLESVLLCEYNPPSLFSGSFGFGLFGLLFIQDGGIEAWTGGPQDGAAEGALSRKKSICILFIIMYINI